MSEEGAFLDYRLNEGGGATITNYAKTNLPADNAWAYAAERASLLNNIGGGTTDYYAAVPDPFGGYNATRLVKAAGSNWVVQPYAATVQGQTYTADFYVRSTDGSPQKFRQNINGMTADITVAGTSWTRQSVTFTAPGNGVFAQVMVADAANEDIDVLVYRFSLRVGTQPAETIPNERSLSFPGYDPYTWTADGGLQLTGYAYAYTAAKFSLWKFSFYAVATAGVDTPGGPYGIFGSDIADGLYFSFANGRVSFASLGITSSNMFRPFDGLPHLYEAKYDGTTLTLLMDGIPVDSTAATLPPRTITGITLGAITQGYKWPGTVYGALAYTNAIPDAQEANQLKAIAKRMAEKPVPVVLAGISKFVIFEGDSLTQTNLDPAITTYPVSVMTSITPKVNARSIAQAGARITGEPGGNNATNRAPIVKACFAPGRLVVIFLAMGTNDLNNGTEASVFANEKAYCQDLRAAAAAVGCTLKIIIRETPPNTHNTSFDGTPMDPHVTALNALRRADISYYDYLVELTDDPVLGAPGAAANTTVYSDGTHWTQNGQDRAEALVLPKVNTALGF